MQDRLYSRGDIFILMGSSRVGSDAGRGATISIRLPSQPNESRGDINRSVRFHGGDSGLSRGVDDNRDRHRGRFTRAAEAAGHAVNHIFFILLFPTPRFHVLGLSSSGGFSRYPGKGVQVRLAAGRQEVIGHSSGNRQTAHAPGMLRPSLTGFLSGVFSRGALPSRSIVAVCYIFQPLKGIEQTRLTEISGQLVKVSLAPIWRHPTLHTAK